MLIFLFCIFIQPLNTINLVYNWGDNICEYTQEVILVYLPLYKAGITYFIQNTTLLLLHLILENGTLLGLCSLSLLNGLKQFPKHLS